MLVLELMGLCMPGLLSLLSIPESILGAIEGLDFVVGRETLEPFSEGLLDTAELDAFESREGGGSWLSGNWVTTGDCNLDDGTEMTTGEDTAVPVELLDMCPLFRNAGLALAPPTKAPSGGSTPLSLVPPTEAFIRL
jgi:hypothetical protein